MISPLPHLEYLYPNLEAHLISLVKRLIFLLPYFITKLKAFTKWVVAFIWTNRASSDGAAIKISSKYISRFIPKALRIDTTGLNNILNAS